MGMRGTPGHNALHFSTVRLALAALTRGKVLPATNYKNAELNAVGIGL